MFLYNSEELEKQITAQFTKFLTGFYQCYGMIKAGTIIQTFYSKTNTYYMHGVRFA